MSTRPQCAEERAYVTEFGGYFAAAVDWIFPGLAVQPELGLRSERYAWLGTHHRNRALSDGPDISLTRRQAAIASEEES